MLLVPGLVRGVRWFRLKEVLMSGKWVVCVCIMSLVLALPAAADVIPIISEGVAADSSETNTVAISTVSGWNVPIASATWVSYANTGAGGFSPADGTTATFTQTFVLPNSNNTGSVEVWADDTADVWLDGVQMFAANLGASNVTCQMGVIGCLPQYGGVVPLDGLSAGSHVLTVKAYQVAGDGFGTLWEGQVTSVPDAGTTLMLLGGVLVGIETLRRKLRA
jgi:hypothetical protein